MMRNLYDAGSSSGARQIRESCKTRLVGAAQLHSGAGLDVILEGLHNGVRRELLQDAGPVDPAWVATILSARPSMPVISVLLFLTKTAY